MRTHGTRRWLATLFVSTALLFTPACGGGSGTGGGGDDDGGGLQPPTNLTYSSLNISVQTDAPIAPVDPSWDGDAPTNWSVAPALPAGLLLEPGTGRLLGTPTTKTDPAVYTVTAFNDAGVDTVDVTIEVDWTDEKSIEAKASPTDDDLRHFMQRTHWGFSQFHWDFLQGIIADPNQGNGDVAAGLAIYVDAMTNLQKQAQLEADGAALYLQSNEPFEPNGNQIANYWLYLQQVNLNPFQEVLAQHWHDHFATATFVLGGNQNWYWIPAPHPQDATNIMEGHINLWRNHASGAGNLRDMLLAMAKDFAMLEWLDGVRNNGGGNNDPNENFSREWFELFCLGVDVLYTQQDIVEGARAFSGYQSFFANGRNFIAPNPNRHDTGSKTVLGQNIPANQTIEQDYASMVDITLNAVDPVHGRSACGRWIVRQILRRFVYENPPENVINDLTEILENDNWDMKNMLMTLFTSRAFFCQRAKTEQFVTTPNEATHMFLRSTGLVADPNQIRTRLFLMGNLPSLPPVVDGWPEGTSWYSAQGMIDRANMLEFILHDQKTVQDNLNIDLRDILPPAPATTGEVVDELALRLRVDLTPTERDELIEFMDNEYNNGVLTPDPFDRTNQDHIDERVRGALYILGLHPTAFTR